MMFRAALAHLVEQLKLIVNPSASEPIGFDLNSLLDKNAENFFSI
tara:strand:+ start:1449 stop:1583 length:135 start_codon:yes stop_codon:yes gene_type:complete